MHDAHTDAFQARLTRLRDLGHRLPTDPKPERAPTRRSRDIARNAVYPLSLAGAFLLDIVAVLFGRVVRFHMRDISAGDVDIGMDILMSGGIGMLTSFALSEMFRLNSTEYRSLQGAGVFAAACAMHNLFYWVPGPMAAVFSPDYVAEMQAIYEPNTVMIGAFRFSLVDDRAPAVAEMEPQPEPATEPRPEAPSLPPVIRRGTGG